ncbi:anthocyanidin reductase ((2S)-flavan-3-ol-forming)-like [Miscanthus floridulus]|uniref:anthocyanidin reductase ((2S)-flavan-3-ol-forming)-like n=1 Tax=Miscanthus floridulus TaxID=154761 RepID=UPI00345ACCC9
MVTAGRQKEQIEPIVRATLNVLRSCVKAGTVRRVVLTSAASSICIPPLEGDGHVLDEHYWSDVDYVTAEKPPAWGYVISKVLAEKEAFRFAQDHGISLVVVCSVLTVGASPAPKACASIRASLSMLSGDEAALAMLKGIEKSFGAVPVIHLHDLCRAEVFLAETATASSGRYICSSIGTTVVEIARFLAEQYPQYHVNIKQSGDDELLEKPRVSLSSAKLVKEGFEFKYNTLDAIYGDVIEYGKALGILLRYW